MSDENVFQCAQCGRVTDHSREEDSVAGMIWSCSYCGAKVRRNEPDAGARITDAQAASPYEQLFLQSMRKSRFADMVDYMAHRMRPEFQGRFTRSQIKRIAAIILRSWKKEPAEIVKELLEAAFDLENGVWPPDQQVARIKKACRGHYRDVYDKKWWQFWKLG